MIDDLTELSDEEDQWVEFKSSLTRTQQLKEKMAAAASAFSNSGGGQFIAGVNDCGDADGGYPLLHGRTSARDWIDQVVTRVVPTPAYEIKILKDCSNRGSLEAGKAIYIVEFDSSSTAPHMAPDGCYYIRAGAHTERATHFLVEALYARQRHQYPALRHLLRLSHRETPSVELVVASLTSEPAVDVELHLDLVGGIFDEAKHLLPIRIPLIDKSNSFVMNIGPAFRMEQRFGEAVELKIIYHNLAGKRFEYRHCLTPLEGLPLLGYKSELGEISSALKDIASKLEK